jgi:NADH-quinone oxidoreductase subunit L
MSIPLIVLAVFSLVGGWFGLPHVISEILPGHPANLLELWTKSLIAPVELYKYSAVIEWSLMGISVAAAGISAAAAYEFYVSRPELPVAVANKFKGTYNLVYKKYFVDEVYFGRVIDPIVSISRGLWAYVDVQFIDKATYWLSDLVVSAGGGIRSLQNGNLQQYAMYVVIGIASIIVILMVG